MFALREDAVTTGLLGIQSYSFGLWVALGLLLAVAVLALIGLRRKQPAGVSALQSALSILLGLVLSRLLYGLLDASLDQIMPLWAMVRLDIGGYSLYGALAGAVIAAALTARITKQKPGDLLDALAPAFLLFTASERLGESVIESFGLSRGLTQEFLYQPWLATLMHW